MWISLYHHCSFVWSTKRVLWSYSGSLVSLLKIPRKVVRKLKQVKWSCPGCIEFQRPYIWYHAVWISVSFQASSYQGVYSERAWTACRYLGYCQCNHSFHSFSRFFQKHQSENWMIFHHSYDSCFFSLQPLTL